MRVLVGAVGALLLAVAGSASARESTANPAAQQPVAAVVRYAGPVAPLRVVRGFDPPPTPFGPGHLGVDLATSPGQAVHSAADGEISFAGSVAGRGLVVVLHPDGIRTEYEPIRPTVHRGDPVHRGTTIGLVDGVHGGCPPGRCLHWGARRGTQYLDPLALLQPLGPVRLLPWTDAQARG